MSKKAGVTIKVKYDRTDELKREVNDFPALLVGVLEPEASRHYKDSTVTIGEVALWNEMGTATIRARSFMRLYTEEAQAKIVNQMTSAVHRVVFANEDAGSALRKIGKEHVSHIVARIKRHIPPPNAPITIERKGSDTPLIDTGVLIDSISYEVVK